MQAGGGAFIVPLNEWRLGTDWEMEYRPGDAPVYASRRWHDVVATKGSASIMKLATILLSVGGAPSDDVFELDRRCRVMMEVDRI